MVETHGVLRENCPPTPLPWVVPSADASHEVEQLPSPSQQPIVLRAVSTVCDDYDAIADQEVHEPTEVRTVAFWLARELSSAASAAALTGRLPG